MVSVRKGGLLVWDGAADSRTKKEEKEGAKKVFWCSKEDKGR